MVVAVVFAVANRTPAALEIWPFGVSLEAPLFLVVLGAAFVGFVAGALVAWLSAGRARRRARAAERRVAELRREVARLNRDRETAPGGTAPGGPRAGSRLPTVPGGGGVSAVSA